MATLGEDGRTSPVARASEIQNDAAAAHELPSTTPRNVQPITVKTMTQPSSRWQQQLLLLLQQPVCSGLPRGASCCATGDVLQATYDGRWIAAHDVGGGPVDVMTVAGRQTVAMRRQDTQTDPCSDVCTAVCRLHRSSVRPTVGTVSSADIRSRHVAAAAPRARACVVDGRWSSCLPAAGESASVNMTSPLVAQPSGRWQACESVRTGRVYTRYRTRTRTDDYRTGAKAL